MLNEPTLKGQYFMALMGIFWIVLLAGIGVLIWWLAGRSGNPRALQETAEEILKRRYARGEINKTQYETTLSDLRR